MARRRMFSMSVMDSDAFLDMPPTSQLLYVHLGMRADDEGFIGNPKRITRMTGASDDDMKILKAKNFIIEFESGVVVIKHWKMHNTIRTDRYAPTTYRAEKDQLYLKENGAYTMSKDGTPLATRRQPKANPWLPQVKLDKANINMPSASEEIRKPISPEKLAIIDGEIRALRYSKRV